MNNANPSNEWVEIDGVTYRVDGEFYISEDESEVIYRGVKYIWVKNYYQRPGASFAKSLHRAVWERHFGKIPKKHHIHHLDRNSRNNHIENLQCLSAKLHMTRSARTNKWVGSQKNLEVMARMREMAKPWHNTPEGKAFHRKAG